MTEAHTVRELRVRVLRLYLEAKGRQVAQLSDNGLARLLATDADRGNLERVTSTLGPLAVRVRAVSGGWRLELLPTGEDATEGTVREVFDYWRQASGHTRAKLSPLRARKVRQRLRDGFTVDDLQAAIDGMVGSDFHRRNKHTDLALALRDVEHVERFRGMAQETQAQAERPEGLTIPAALRAHMGAYDGEACSL
tara:strand:+ start:385 stop:969 length:585 start_codon:yes stop_codon:yes gene_type:complete